MKKSKKKNIAKEKKIQEIRKHFDKRLKMELKRAKKMQKEISKMEPYVVKLMHDLQKKMHDLQKKLHNIDEKYAWVLSVLKDISLFLLQQQGKVNEKKESELLHTTIQTSSSNVEPRIS